MGNCAFAFQCFHIPFRPHFILWYLTNVISLIFVNNSFPVSLGAESKQHFSEKSYEWRLYNATARIWSQIGIKWPKPDACSSRPRFSPTYLYGSLFCAIGSWVSLPFCSSVPGGTARHLARRRKLHNNVHIEADPGYLMAAAVEAVERREGIIATRGGWRGLVDWGQANDRRARAWWLGGTLNGRGT